VLKWYAVRFNKRAEIFMIRDYTWDFYGQFSEFTQVKKISEAMALFSDKN